MIHRTAPHIGNCALPPQRESAPRRRWWDTLLHSLGCGRTPDAEHEWPAGDHWSTEQDLVLRYHARNLAAARRSAEQLVCEGWHTGPVPYGYRPQRIRISPAGRRPRYRTRLMIEPVEASVVKMIFLWRVQDNLSTDEIVRNLTGSRYPAPLRPNSGEPGSWTTAAVRAILRNPKYTGYQVWGRKHHGRSVPRESWVWSPPWAHPPVVDTETFAAAQRPLPRAHHGPAEGGQAARAA